MKSQVDEARRECMFLYDHGDIKGSKRVLGWQMTAYLWAMSLVSDIKEDARKVYLDFGCGSGWGAEILATWFERAYGVDRNPVCVEYAKAVHNRSNVEFCLEIPGDCYRASFVTMIEVIEHMPKDEATETLRDIYEVMDDGAVLYLTTPKRTQEDGKNPDNHFHIHEYCLPELRDLVASVFRKQPKISSPFDGSLFLQVAK